MGPTFRDGTSQVRFCMPNDVSARGAVRRFLNTDEAHRYLRQLCVTTDGLRALRLWAVDQKISARPLPRNQDKFLAMIAGLLCTGGIVVATEKRTQGSRKSSYGMGAVAEPPKVERPTKQHKRTPQSSEPAMTPSMLIADAAKEAEKPKTWIEIELVGEDDEPIPFERYELRTASGSVHATGRLNAFGLARHDPIDEDAYQVVFLDLDQDAWKGI